jgi:hypothetical protein
MLQKRTFRVVFVHKDHGVGVGPSDEPDKIVPYTGTKLTVTP